MSNRTVGLVSLGCSKNRVDSEVLLGILRDEGYQIVADPAQAELIFVNTCGFIQPAKEESIEAIFEMAEYKKTGRCKLLIVTGCLSQRYGEDLKKEIPEVDAFLGVSEYPNLLSAIERAEHGQRPLMTSECDRFFKAPRVLTNGDCSAYIKISDGCDNRCSYCAIPLIRGPYRSRGFQDIVDECRQLSEAGAHELTLIAQDTSRYGNDFPGGQTLLPELLRQVHALPGVHWLRVLYCYPDTVDDALLDTIVSLPKCAKYLDLPLQHIDGDLLEIMNRRGSPEHIRSLIEKCRQRGIDVRTTFIVGFPGETEEQFRALCEFVKWARFARMGAFSYSPEEGTVGADLPGQIDEETKRRRLDELMLLQQGISYELNEARVGEEAEALVESFEDGYYLCRTLREAPEVDGVVRVKSSRDISPGSYIKVRITSADAYDLFGEEMRV